MIGRHEGTRIPVGRQHSASENTWCPHVDPSLLDVKVESRQTVDVFQNLVMELSR